MFGNMLNADLILRLLSSGHITIAPFHEKLLKVAHYPLRAQLVHKLDAPGRLCEPYSFDDNPAPFVMGPNEYVVVGVRESLRLDAGIVGQFVPASNLIEQGLGITVGRLEHPFGQQGERVRFGLKNLLDRPNHIGPTDLLAYVQFFDLRGLASKPVKLSERDVAIFKQRIPDARTARAEDDGVFYQESSDGADDPASPRKP